MTLTDLPGTAKDPLHDALRRLVSPQKFDLWFASMQLLERDDASVVLSVANPFQLEWIHTYYTDVVKQAVEETWGESLSWKLVVRPATPSTAEPPQASPARAHEDAASMEHSNHDFFLSNSDVTLNGKYTFDNFVVGPSNQLAHAAAFAVANAPAGAYNPLFLHGDVGLGKTHLLQAICHKAMQSGRSLKILYLSSETFVNEFIAAVEKGDLSRFRYRYRNVDMLLIDDIHLLANKERTQEEFFHTFNQLYNGQRQIVLSSDSSPSEIPTLKERLIGRFKWGLVAEISPPIYETRLAILRRRAHDRQIDMPEDVLSFLAENIDRNIRELEGAITKVVGLAHLIHREIDVDLARQALGQSHHENHRGVTGVERILETVCQHFGVRVSDLQGRKRTQSIALPRQVAMFLARQLTPLSLEEIGGHFGGRDHSTVLYAHQRIKDRIADDRSFADLVRQLENRARR